VATTGEVATDGVGPHTDLLNEFPYRGGHIDGLAELPPTPVTLIPRSSAGRRRKARLELS